MAEKLPIYEIEAQILAQAKVRRRLMLQAPTGSGKSTQVPQMLWKSGLLGGGQVVILQPRRLAVRLLAARVAQECGVALGEEVGYQIRFDNRTSKKTVVRYVTEGILLRQMLQDPLLSGVTAVLFDEFHERHLYGDISLARALDLQENGRPDLIVMVMSATLQTGALAEYLRPCAFLASEGRAYPVDIDYARWASGDNGRPVWDLAAEAFQRHVQRGDSGDVLVFMPGGYEIQQTIDAIRERPEASGYVVLPLHGELSPQDQDAAVARHNRPKVVVSTNVAETSLTIDGIRLVIDSGLARIPRYDPNRGINTLLVEKTSRSSADQRAGRAGRTAPGRCERLWSLADHQERPAHDTPEIKRLDLADVVLTLKASGIADLRTFRWLEPPSERGLLDAETLLADLEALDRHGAITPLGRQMLAFPMHPRYSRMLLAAQAGRCVRQAALIAALTQGRDLLIRNPGRDVEAFREDAFGGPVTSDFWILMRAWEYAVKNQFRPEACRKAGVHALAARQVGPLLDHFLQLASDQGLDTRERTVPDEALRQCILTGFSDRVARRPDERSPRCDLVHGRRGALARESAVHSGSLLVAAEIREVQGADGTLTTLLSLATAIEAEWLRDLFPEDMRNALRVYYDPAIKRVCAEEQWLFRELPIATRRVEPAPADQAAQLLAGEVVRGNLALDNWDEQVEQWILRLNRLAEWCPEFELPKIEEESRQMLIEQICHGAFSHKDIKDRDVKSIVKSWLSQAQQDLLDKHAPERFALPNGRKSKIVYSGDGQPYLATRLADLFDLKATPRIAMNRVPVLLHILAPNMRPVQITQDLAGFWKDHYPRIKQELQRKYPRHEWR